MILSALVFIVSGCSVAPFKEGRKVEVETGFLGSKYFKQDGQVINHRQMANYLATRPESRDAVARAGRWNTAGLASGGAAIGLAVGAIVANPKENRGTSNALLFSALGMLIVENFCFVKGAGALENAVEQYNDALKVAIDGDTFQTTYDLVRF